MRRYKSFGRQNSRAGYKADYRNETYNRERHRSRARERTLSGDIKRNDRSISNSRSRSGSRVSTNRYRIRCYKCMEYDHFAKEYPMTKEKGETEQIQQLFSLDKEQTSLKTLATDTNDRLSKIHSLGDILLAQEHLNL